MVKFSWTWFTNTMVFEDENQVVIFLKAFSEKTPCYNELIEQQKESGILIKHSISVRSTIVNFAWYFTSREDYKNFQQQIKRTRFVTLLKKLGWKSALIGSK